MRYQNPKHHVFIRKCKCIFCIRGEASSLVRVCVRRSLDGHRSGSSKESGVSRIVCRETCIYVSRPFAAPQYPPFPLPKFPAPCICICVCALGLEISQLYLSVKRDRSLGRSAVVHRSLVRWQGLGCRDVCVCEFFDHFAAPWYSCPHPNTMLYVNYNLFISLALRGILAEEGNHRSVGREEEVVVEEELSRAVGGEAPSGCQASPPSARSG